MSDLDFTTLRQGGADCPSDYALDRHQAGEDDNVDARVIQEHVEQCGVCSARLAERAEGAAAWKNADASQLWRAIEEGASEAAPTRGAEVVSLPRGGIIAGLVALAAAVALTWLPDDVRHSNEDAAISEQADPAAAPAPTTRAKGPLSLRVHRQRGDRSEEVASGAEFAEGDQLRFEVFLPEPGEVRVLGLETDGTLYTAWPLSDDIPTHFDAPGSKLLGGAVSLDDSVGREMFYALRCPANVGRPECKSTGADEPPSCPAGCELSPFTLRKIAP